MLLSTVLFLTLLTVPVLLLFYKILFSVNLISVYVYCTIIFSGIGIYLYGFTDIFSHKYQFLHLELLSDRDYANAVLIVHGGLLLVFLGYAIPARMTTAFVRRPSLFLPISSMVAKPQRFGVKLMVVVVLFLTLVYFFKHHATLISAELGTNIILNSLTSHTTQIALRYSLSKDFFFIVFTTSILTYFTIYITALRNRITGVQKYAWILLLVIAIFLHLGLFQKRPLILFLVTFFWVYSVTRPGVSLSPRFMIRAMLTAMLLGFVILSGLYFIIFSGMGNDFSLWKVLFISITQVLVRLANSALMTAHIYPEIDPFFGLNNVRAITVLFNFDFYPKDKIMFDIFSTSNNEGSTASAALVDFYGGFGWFGLVVLAPLLGCFFYLVEAYIRTQPNTLDRFIFTIFSCWFVYYLTQANFFRAAHGYGFFYFVVLRYLFLLSIPNIFSQGKTPARHQKTI